MPDVLGEIIPDVGAKVWESAKTKTVCRKRLYFLLFFMCRRIGEYISLELFYFVDLTSSSLIPCRRKCWSITPSTHYGYIMANV